MSRPKHICFSVGFLCDDNLVLASEGCDDISEHRGISTKLIYRYNTPELAKKIASQGRIKFDSCCEIEQPKRFTNGTSARSHVFLSEDDYIHNNEPYIAVFFIFKDGKWYVIFKEDGEFILLKDVVKSFPTTSNSTR